MKPAVTPVAMVALLVIVASSGCKENPPPPPAPVPLTRDAVEQAAEAKRELENPSLTKTFGPWGRWEHVEHASLAKPYLRINSIWGLSTNDVWVLGSDQLATVVAHNDGHGFATAQSLEGSGRGVLGGRSSSDRWVVGTFARHATTGELEQAKDVVGARDLRALTLAPEGTLWAVGEHGKASHQSKADDLWVSEIVGPDVPGYSAGKTTPSHRGEEARGTVKPGLNGVWATNDLVIAVGEVGTILERTPTRGWEPMASGTLEELRGVWGTLAQDIWAVGDRGTILHYAGGAEWQPISSGTQADLYAVWGAGPSDVWAVGSVGALLHWDGKVWTPIPSGTQEVLLALWGDGKGEIWATGGNATILHHLPR